MSRTRIPTPEVRTSTEQAIAQVRAARAKFESLFPALSEAQRTASTRPPKSFPPAGRKLMQASIDHPNLAGAVAYDRAAVAEDLDNLDVLYPLQQEIAQLKQVVDDAVLLCGDEAYRASLALYAVAKAVAPTNPSVEQAVRPLASIFGGPRDTGDVETPAPEKKVG